MAWGLSHRHHGLSLVDLRYSMVVAGGDEDEDEDEEKMVDGDGDGDGAVAVESVCV